MKLRRNLQDHRPFDGILTGSVASPQEKSAENIEDNNFRPQRELAFARGKQKENPGSPRSRETVPSARQHSNNFRPSQKSPIPLNRYDDFVDDLSQRSRSQDQTPEPRLVARALYNFVGQSSRELTFRRGDLIFVRRQVDKNWYEGEYNAMIGLFPSNYVEVIVSRVLILNVSMGRVKVEYPPTKLRFL